MEKILVTGSSSGIGEATCRLFCDLGFEVIGVDRKPPTVSHKNFKHYTADIRYYHQLPDLEGLSYIVFNAGVLYDAEDPIGVNLFGTFTCEDKYVRANLSTLKSIVILSSIAAHDGQDCRAYVASKGALISYTLYLANHLGKYGIRVNSLSPGAGETPMNRMYMDEKIYKAVAAENLLNRWNQPEECAAAIRFFLIDATFVTGQDLKIDGGETMKTRYVWGDGDIHPY